MSFTAIIAASNHTPLGDAPRLPHGVYLSIQTFAGVQGWELRVHNSDVRHAAQHPRYRNDLVSLLTQGLLQGANVTQTPTMLMWGHAGQDERAIGHISVPRQANSPSQLLDWVAEGRFGIGTVLGSWRFHFVQVEVLLHHPMGFSSGSSAVGFYADAVVWAHDYRSARSALYAFVSTENGLLKGYKSVQLGHPLLSGESATNKTPCWVTGRLWFGN